MKYPRIPLAATALAFALASGGPAWAVSAVTTGPAQPLPQLIDHGHAVPDALPVAESPAAGSAALVPLMAADLPSTPPDTEAGAPDGGGNVGKTIDDLAFVARATDSGRKEVAAAREALPQLKDPDLKRLAQALVGDHGSANAELAKIAAAKKWPLPAPPLPAAPPAGTASPDFDAKWTAEMIAAHERSVALYGAQASGGEDPDLRRFARETLPTIQHHLAELRRLQK